MSRHYRVLQTQYTFDVKNDDSETISITTNVNDSVNGRHNFWLQRNERDGRD